MSELEDIIIMNSDKRFRLRIDGYLRGIGISQILGTKEYLEIEFIGGECGIRVLYPRKLEDLHELIKQELLLETQLMPKEINTISYFINECVGEIESVLKKLKYTLDN